ncbi:MAG: MCE family protein, partial [Mycobacterium sp.]
MALAITVVATPWWDGTAKTIYVAHFANTNGLFVGDEVRILGVAVGTVDKIEPQPVDSKVTFSVESQYPVPADARAAILSPSLITARAIQLVPAYSGGAKLPAGASIPLDRTAVPVEWDDFRQQLEKLTESLQPTTPGGVNPLGEFIDSAAANLRGQGDTARDTIIKLSQAISALGDHSTDIYGTIRNLQLLVSALHSSSELLASFNQNFASATTLLTNTPNELADAVKGLDRALSDLRGFVAENREGLGVTFDRLSSITTALNESRDDIKQLGHITPSVFQNFVNIY